MARISAALAAPQFDRKFILISIGHLEQRMQHCVHAAMMLAPAHTLLIEGRHDQTMIDWTTSGWAQFKAYLLGSDGSEKTAGWAAAICDVARDMACNRTMISVAWGLQRGDYGEQPLWAGLAVAAMLGQLGRPGTGFGFGYGSTTPVGRLTKIFHWLSIPQGPSLTRCRARSRLPTFIW